MKKGVVLEILYSSAIKSLSLRRYIFMNAQNFVFKIKHGQGVIVSSGGGDSVLDFRSPQDVANLSNLFGLTGAACLDSVSTTCMKCVDHANLRKLTFKGAVKVEDVVKAQSEIHNDDKDNGDDIPPVRKKQKLSTD